MAKLTNELRKGITKKLIDERFEKEWEALRAKEQAIGERAYNKFVKPYLDHLEALPEQWVIHTSTIRLYSNQYGHDDFALKERRILPRGADSYHTSFFRCDQALSRIVGNYKNARDKLTEEQRNLKQETESALRSFNTTKRLREGWPEVAHLVPEDVKFYPMVFSLGSLNEKLMLKSVEA